VENSKYKTQQPELSLQTQSLSSATHLRHKSRLEAQLKQQSLQLKQRQSSQDKTESAASASKKMQISRTRANGLLYGQSLDQGQLTKSVAAPNAKKFISKVQESQ